MNRGLYPLPDGQRFPTLGGWRSPFLKPNGNGQTNIYPSPFPLPMVVQSVLVCISPTLGYEVGDQWHDCHSGGNSTVGTIDFSTYRADAQYIITKNGGGGSGSSRSAFSINGTLGYIPVANFNERMMALGALTPDLLGIPGVGPVRRYTAPVRRLSLDALFSERNPFGRAPLFMRALMRCRIPEQGYRFGDVVDMAAAKHIDSAASAHKASLRSNDKVMDIRHPNTAPILFNAVTAAAFNVTVANWDIYFEAIG